MYLSIRSNIPGIISSVTKQFPGGWQDASYPTEVIVFFFLSSKCVSESHPLLFPKTKAISKFPLLLQSSLTTGTEVTLSPSLSEGWRNRTGTGLCSKALPLVPAPANASVAQITTMPPEKTAARGRDGTDRVKA